MADTLLTVGVVLGGMGINVPVTTRPPSPDPSPAPTVGPDVGLWVGPRIGPRVGLIAEIAMTTLTVTIVGIQGLVDPVITHVDFDQSIQVTNTGSRSATNVTCVITLDPSLTFVAASGSGWTCNQVGGVVTCTRATLAIGAAPLITITVTTADTAGTETTTADVHADNALAATQDMETTTVVLVSRDATSGKRVPASSAEWDNFDAYHTALLTPNFPYGSITPVHLWLLQEASGNPADTIGSATLTGTGLAYNVAQSGWTRTAIETTDNSADSASSVSATLPDLLTESALLLAYAAITATPAGTRGVAALGGLGVTAAKIHVNTTPAIVGIHGANSATGATTIGTGVMPLVIQHDVDSPAARIYTETDKIAPTFSVLVAGKTTQLGTTATGAAPARYLYAVEFTGGDAEMTTANVKALLSALGWTPTWTA